MDFYVSIGIIRDGANMFQRLSRIPHDLDVVIRLLVSAGSGHYAVVIHCHYYPLALSSPEIGDYPGSLFILVV